MPAIRHGAVAASLVASSGVARADISAVAGRYVAVISGGGFHASSYVDGALPPPDDPRYADALTIIPLSSEVALFLLPHGR